MLSKINRLSKKDVDYLFKDGKSSFSGFFTFKFIKNINSLPPKVAFIVPKSIAKKAVLRNLLRRKGYSAVKKYISLLPSGFVGVFVFKNSKIDNIIIDSEIKNIFNKIKL